MQIVQDKLLLKQIVGEIKTKGLSIGFVPTMGFFHAGHLSLMRAARAENDFIIVSVFVNRLQFGEGEDYAEYPRDPAGDREMAASEGVDLIFSPALEEIYPPGYSTFVEVEKLSAVLCGASRPGHFRGVCTVVTKLFHLVEPDRAYFGWKDAQQALIIKKMIRDLNFNLKLIVLPTVREDDGLALSSRNKYLSPEERKEAPAIYAGLREAERLINGGIRDALMIKRAVLEKISSAKNCAVDYIEIVDTGELRPVKMLQGECLLAVAVKLGKVRLIDNIIVNI